MNISGCESDLAFETRPSQGLSGAGAGQGLGNGNGVLLERRLVAHAQGQAFDRQGHIESSAQLFDHTLGVTSDHNGSFHNSVQRQVGDQVGTAGQSGVNVVELGAQVRINLLGTGIVAGPSNHFGGGRALDAQAC